jgi:hypothetical protein
MDESQLSGNLPPKTVKKNTTTAYFNNFYTRSPNIGPNQHDAVLGYFQQLTGDTDTGKALAGAVIATALQQNLDPVDLVEQLKILSDRNKAKSTTYTDYIDPNQVDTNVTSDNGATWTSDGNQYAKPGPSTVYTSISEVDAYLTMFLNLNRVGTSLLGLSNSPQPSKYVQRAILP